MRFEECVNHRPPEGVRRRLVGGGHPEDRISVAEVVDGPNGAGCPLSSELDSMDHSTAYGAIGIPLEAASCLPLEVW